MKLLLLINFYILNIMFWLFSTIKKDDVFLLLADDIFLPRRHCRRLLSHPELLPNRWHQIFCFLPFLLPDGTFATSNFESKEFRPQRNRSARSHIIYFPSWGEAAVIYHHCIVAMPISISSIDFFNSVISRRICPDRCTRYPSFVPIHPKMEPVAPSPPPSPTSINSTIPCCSSRRCHCRRFSIISCWIRCTSLIRHGSINGWLCYWTKSMAVAIVFIIFVSRWCDIIFIFVSRWCYGYSVQRHHRRRHRRHLRYGWNRYRGNVCLRFADDDVVISVRVDVGRMPCVPGGQLISSLSSFLCS